eukprot:gnl/MRDRNA2_/MRDRNA2_19909_c0_seq1.p1 gnl/MRDRNA2_/MRDRNA2_19909_c0~~gnl/MRDRNA2_/MRDRNA2_19909_c0_seq1.p1  ORF type:complete len:640 (+),score=114.12 gnl/MRDRNA2_/MRDRNA2_19909_c0_seq1:76-1995(+)
MASATCFGIQAKPRCRPVQVAAPQVKSLLTPITCLRPSTVAPGPGFAQVTQQSLQVGLSGNAFQQSKPAQMKLVRPQARCEISDLANDLQILADDLRPGATSKAGENPMVASPGLAALVVGDVAFVGGEEYQITKKVGQGAFGKVWSVQQTSVSQAPNELALKVMSFMESDAAAQEAAEFEVDVVKYLEANLSASVKNARRVPSYVGHDVSAGISGKKSVAYVMTLLQGGPLDKWLYGLDEADFVNIDPRTVLYGPLSTGRLGTMSFLDASRTAKMILTSLSPIFATLQQFAFHRDISNHNILICDVSQDVSLIDFGLATSTDTWNKRWKTSNIAGDPRYWTPSAWLIFASDAQSLETDPNQGLLRQYKERVDHFSMGILTLEVFFALGKVNGDHTLDDLALRPVQMAWYSYWQFVIELYQECHKSRKSGNISKMRMEMAIRKSGAVRPAKVDQLLQRLQVLGKSLKHFSLSVPEHAAASLLYVCADLIDERGTLSWTEVAHVLASGKKPVEHAAMISTVSKDANADTKDAEKIIQKRVKRAASPGKKRDVPRETIHAARSGSFKTVERQVRTTSRNAPIAMLKVPMNSNLTPISQGTALTPGYRYSGPSVNQILVRHGTTMGMNDPNRLILHGCAKRL